MCSRGLLTGVVIVLWGAALSAAEDMQKTVTVAGTGKVEAKADVAYVTLFVKGEGILMTDAVRKAEEMAGDVENAVRENHPTVTEVTVAPMEVGERRREVWSSAEREESPRPQAVKRIRITLPPDPDLAYAVIDTAMRAGAVMQIPSSTSYSSDVRSVVIYGLAASATMEEKAGQEAVNDARREAETIAALVGKRIGDVVSVTCGRSSSWMPEFRIMGREMEPPAEYLGLDPERIPISYTATVSYELVDK